MPHTQHFHGNHCDQVGKTLDCESKDPDQVERQQFTAELQDSLSLYFPIGEVGLPFTSPKGFCCNLSTIFNIAKLSKGPLQQIGL